MELNIRLPGLFKFVRGMRVTPISAMPILRHLPIRRRRVARHTWACSWPRSKSRTSSD